MPPRARWMAAAVVCALFAGTAFAQDSSEPQRSTGWRRVDSPREGAPSDSAPPAAMPVRPPAEIVIPAGTWLTVRVDQMLSSDRNLPGDVFTASLAQPLVANGFVLARRGQTLGGRVAEAQKAGRAKGTSRLAIEMTEMTLADGRQLPIRTQMVEYSGGTSHGSDATAIATTTGLGAAIGAAADGGFGAGMGAIAGVAASTIGVLVTRGRPTEIYPEAVLTFRIVEPVMVDTGTAEQAFQPVRQGDYETRLERRGRPPEPAYYPPYYGGPMYYPYPYWGPGWWGPSFYFYSGPRFFYGGRGHWRRW